jgi:regulation of enolase protein 1 (concanavalin A-like superfamily)
MQIQATAAVRRGLTVVVCVCMSAATALAQSVSAPWSSADIGNPVLAGTASLLNGTFTLEAAGTDIWGTADQFRFVYQAVPGNVDIRARVDAVSAADAWSRAGVMIRANLTAGSPHAVAVVSSANGIAFQRRTAAGGVSTSTAGPLAAPPRWVRLVRAGTNVTAYSSADGSTWAVIGTDTIALGATAYVGLAATSHSPSARTTVKISDVAVTGTLPAGQSATDIGAPALRGSTQFVSGFYVITGAGTDIWDSADQFQYVYEQLSGDLDVVAHVTSLSFADSWSKVGVMIRETLDSNSRHATTFVSYGKGYAFQRRVNTGSLSDHTAGGTGAAPGWIRLVRAGSLFTSYRSSDGQTWTKIGSATIVMSAAVYVGIAITSHRVDLPTTAIVDALRITPAQPPANRPPAVSLISPVDGSAYRAPANFILAALASDADGQVSAVEFYSGSTLLGRATTSPFFLSLIGVPSAIMTLTAVAIDNKGATTTSAAVTVTVGVPSGTGGAGGTGGTGTGTGTGGTGTGTGAPPRAIAFAASVDHATLVTNYVLEVYRMGATIGSTAPVATSDLGKPAVDANGDITVDRSALFQALAAGSYFATVTAVGAGGNSRSSAVSFTR